MNSHILVAEAKYSASL